MKKFILVVFGDFSTYEICKDVALSLTPLVDSPNLKFQHKRGAMIFHFASEVSQDEIVDYINGTLLDITDSFILSEFNDKVSLIFPDDIKEHLLNLEESNSDEVVVENNNEQTEGNDDDEYLKTIIKELKKNIKKPTLDQLLEKIQENGISSLSPFEKEVLDEYSKK